MRFQWIFCGRTPSAVFHFEDLEPAGVAAYSKRFGEREKKQKKIEVKVENGEVKVKEELDETLRSATYVLHHHARIGYVETHNRYDMMICA